MIGAFGEPIKCYGETTRRGRRQQVRWEFWILAPKKSQCSLSLWRTWKQTALEDERLEYCTKSFGWLFNFKIDTWSISRTEWSICSWSFISKAPSQASKGLCIQSQKRFVLYLTNSRNQLRFWFICFIPTIHTFVWILFNFSPPCFLQNPETGKYEFRYIFVEVDTYPRRTIIIEDNRWKSCFICLFFNRALFSPRVDVSDNRL